jgi:TorA maturation chaperone TorD
MIMHNSEHAVQEMMRGECCRFLAACFYQPKKETLGAADFLSALEQNLQQVCPAAAPSARRMQDGLAAYTDEELAVEYARLFVGPFGLKAPPYGSVYLDGGRTVMGPSTMETIRFYEEEGLVRDESFTELPDHIAVELEFLYFLLYRQVEALQKGDMNRAEAYRLKEEQFRTRFLGTWIPPFCAHIREETDHPFYNALAECLTVFVQAPA